MGDETKGSPKKSEPMTPEQIKQLTAATSIGLSVATDAASGIALGQTIKLQGEEAIRNITAIGKQNQTQYKNALADLKVVQENAGEMLTEVERNAAIARAQLTVQQAESNLGGTSKQEARNDISMTSNEDEGNIKRMARNKRVQLVKDAIGKGDQAMEDINAIKSQMVTEKEVIANGIVQGLSRAASTATTAYTAGG